MTKTLALLILLGTNCAAASLKVSKYARVYKGDEGVSVTVVQVSPKDSNKALLKVTGIETAIDGLVLLHAVETEEGVQRFTFTYDGKGKVTLFADGDNWLSDWLKIRMFQLYVPENANAMQVFYNETASSAVNAEAILKEYEEQEKRGAQAKLAHFDRKAAVSRIDKEYAAAAQRAGEACGGKFRAEISWPSISDEQMTTLSIPSFCSGPLDALRNICDEPKKKIAVNKKIKRVVCAFGADMRLKLKPDGTVLFTTFKDAANVEIFSRNNLQNQL